MKVAVAVLLAAPRIPSSAALKLASVSEDHGPLSLGLLRAMEVVRSRYERAWALVSAAEPSADDLATALELLQVRPAQSYKNVFKLRNSRARSCESLTRSHQAAKKACARQSQSRA